MKHIILGCLLLFLLTPSSLALDRLTQDAQSAAGILPPNAAQAIKGMSPDNASIDKGIENILNSAGNMSLNVFKKAVLQMTLVLIVVILCSIASAFCGNIDFVDIGGVAAIAMLTIGNFNSLINDSKNVISHMNAFNTALLPIMAQAAGAMGLPAGAAAKHSAAVFFAGLLTNLFERLFFPMLYAFLALTTVNAIIGKDILARAASFIKWCMVSLMTACLFAFIAYITLSGAIAGSADALAVKSLRMAVSNAVPVVGGIIADASETVLIGARMIKNTVGIFGLFAVLGIFITPFLELGVRYLIYKLTGALASPVANEKLCKYIDSISAVFGLALSMVASSTLLILISISSFILLSGAN